VLNLDLLDTENGRTIFLRNFRTFLLLDTLYHSILKQVFGVSSDIDCCAS